MLRDEEERKTRSLEFLNALELTDSRNTLIRDLPHPKQIMLQYYSFYIMMIELLSRFKAIVVSFSLITPSQISLLMIIHVYELPFSVNSRS